MKLSKRALSVALGIPLSILFLYLAFRQVDLGKTWNLLKSANYIYLIPAGMVLFIDFLIRAWRWKIMLKPIKNISYKELVSNIFIGFMANSTLPMRAGEIIRVIHLSEKEKIPRSSVLATIILERATDVFAILFLLTISFITLQLPPFIKKIWIITFTILLISLFLLYGLMFKREQSQKILLSILAFLPARPRIFMKNFLGKFIDGLEILKQSKRMLLMAALSILSWMANSSILYFIAKGVGYDSMSIFGAFFVTTIVALGIAIPSSPGFIGVFEYFGVLGCTIIGIDKSVAMTIVLLNHYFQLIMIITAGAGALAREHLSLFQLDKKALEEDSIS